MVDERTWQDYFAILLRRRWWFLVPFTAIMVGALVMGLTTPKEFESKTVILVEEEKIINPLISGLAISTTVGERLRTLREEILSWPSLMELIKRLEMDGDLKDQLAYEKKIKEFREDITVGMSGPNLIVISYQDKGPKKAQEVVNAITDIFVQRNVAYQNDESVTAIGFIEEQMAIYKKKLEDSEASLREFKEVYSQEIPVAASLNEQIVALEVQLANLLVNNTEAHPAVRATRQHIEALRQRRNQEIERIVVNTAHFNLRPNASPEEIEAARKQAVETIVTRMEMKASAPIMSLGPTSTTVGTMSVSPDATMVTLSPKQEQELMRLTRDYQVNSGLYQHLQERLEKAKISQRLEHSDQGTKFRVIDPARLPLEPVSPNLPRIMIVAFLLACVVGTGCAYGAEFLDGSFKEADDVKQMLELPLLGSISRIITPQDVVERIQLWRHRAWVTATVTFGAVVGLAVTTFLTR